MELFKERGDLVSWDGGNMEQRTNAYEEELIVPLNATARTTDMQITVGCSHECDISSRATITVSLNSDDQKEAQVKPGQSVEVRSPERSYQITMLSIAQNKIHVHVICSPI